MSRMARREGAFRGGRFLGVDLRKLGCGCAEWCDVRIPERAERKPGGCEWRGWCRRIGCDGRDESEPAAGRRERRGDGRWGRG